MHMCNTGDNAITKQIHITLTTIEAASLGARLATVWYWYSARGTFTTAERWHHLQINCAR